MRKIVSFCALSALVRAHDADKCLENGRFDDDCCAAAGHAACKDDYQLTWGTTCYLSTEITAYNYYCDVKAPPIKKSTIKAHDPTKCRQNGRRDHDCCATAEAQSCADGYVTTWSDVCAAGKDWSARTYYCTRFIEAGHYGRDDDRYDPYKDSSRGFEVEDLYDELPAYDPENDLGDDATLLDDAEYYKWGLNLWLVAVPWIIFGGLMVTWNLWFNADWNRIWAEGNFWLMSNTAYIVVQYLASILVIVELPVYLRAFRITRLWAFFSAIIYTLFYFASAFEWYDMLYIVTDKSQYDFVTIFVNMFLGYNLVLHSSVIPINIAIIIKELTLNFFSLIDDRNPGESPEYLSTDDIGYVEEDTAWALNPFTWLDAIWEPLFGYDAEDYAFENPDDEAHYYKNWGSDDY